MTLKSILREYKILWKPFPGCKKYHRTHLALLFVRDILSVATQHPLSYLIRKLP